MWLPPDVLEQYESQQREALLEAEEKAEEAKRKAEEDARKTPEEKLFEAKENCKIAGDRFCLRVVGMLDRETSKLVDQFPILEGLEDEVSEIVSLGFLIALDKEIRERGLLPSDEEDEKKSEENEAGKRLP